MTTSSLDLPSATLFANRFRILGDIASGGMGSVHRAEQLSNGRIRALKLLHPQLSQDAKFRARFEFEARIGSRIASNHIVEVIDAGIDDATGTPWLAMELLDGLPLHEHVEPWPPLSPAAAWEILAQLGDALAAAHDAGVIHLDLKPENLFMANVALHGVNAPVLKVLDFGISRVMMEGYSSYKLTTPAGTMLWMAPEQTRTDESVRLSSDVWSVGLLTFWLLTRKRYWREANVRKPIARKLHQEIQQPTHDAASVRARELGVERPLPTGFDDWFRRCVERDPRARFQHAREAFDALGEVLTPSGGISETRVLSTPPLPPVEFRREASNAPVTVDPTRGTVAVISAQAGDATTWLAPGALAESTTVDDARPEEDDSAAAWAARAEAQLTRGQWEDAVTNYCMAIERDPRVAAYWYGRSVAFRELRYDAMMRADLAQAAALGHPLARR